MPFGEAFCVEVVDSAYSKPAYLNANRKHTNRATIARARGTRTFYCQPEPTDKLAQKGHPAWEVKAFDKALSEAGVTHTVSIYEGQPHAFVEDVAGIQSGGAQGEAWAEMLDFLNENLKNAPSSRNGESIAYAAEFDWYYYAMLAYEHAFETASHQQH